MRTIVDLTDEQSNALNLLAKEERVSKAKLLRQAVDILVEQKKRARQKKDFEKCFGLWRDRNIDSVAYVEALRNEWNRDSSA